jgi:hypothetical protein
MDWTLWTPAEAVVLAVAVLWGIACLAHKNRYGSRS